MHPMHKGFPDYAAELNATPENIPIKIECKGAKDRFLIRDLRTDQRHWLNKYTSYNGKAYIWLQLGDKRVNSNHNYRRQVWLVPYDVFFRSMFVMVKCYKLKYIPLQLEKGMRLKDESMTVKVLFAQYAMEWMPKLDCWRPNEQHPIWKLPLEISYVKFDGERQ